MAVLGLILLAAAGVLTAAVVTSNTDSLAVDMWGVSVSNVTLGVVFVAGMITTVVAVVGLGLLMGGLRRNSRLRKERRSLRRENEQLSQRVDSTPDTSAPMVRHEERTVADDRTRVQPDDRTRVQPTAPNYDEAPGHDATAPNGPTADGSSTAPRRRSFLPHREDRGSEDRGTETVSRDA